MRRRLGDWGEGLAAAHLEAKGYSIRQRNFRCREGEVDIVAEKGGCLVFVEVRTRRGQAMGSAGESVTGRKRGRLLAVARAYEQEHGDLPPERRIDVITIALSTAGKFLRLEHLEGAVVEGMA